MNSFPTLSKAPIVEAIVELRTRLPEPATESGRKSFAEALHANFPSCQDIRFISAKLQFGLDTKSPEVADSVVGVRLDSADSKWVVQAKSDGLALSRMAPYESWSNLREMLRLVWEQYVRVFRPEVVARIGVRFINRLPVSGDVIDFDELLTAGPKIPPSLPQNLIHFTSNVVLPIPDLAAVVSITQTMEVVPTGSSAVRMDVILDIDAFSEDPLSVHDERLWERLEALHTAKNSAFFGALTASALETYR